MRLLYTLFIILFFCSCDERLGSLKPLDMDTVQVEENGGPSSLKLVNPSAGSAHLPRFKAQDGKLHITWVEQEDSLAILKYAVYASAKWSPAETIASGTDWFVNWADFPAVAINDGTVMATFLQKSAKGTYDYDVKYSLRNKETQTWSSPKTLHDDGVAAEHGFVSLLPYKQGFFATWLDGRSTKSTRGHDNHSHGGNGAMTLRSALIDTNGKVTKRTELDSRICDCCNTAAVQTEKGIVVVYRDRSEGQEEVRDIYRTIWNEDQKVLPAPVYNDNWLINGCPVNGPAIDTLADTVVTAWFTAADDVPSVKLAFSKDSGLNFGDAIRVDAGDAIGRVDVVASDENSAYVLWMEQQGDGVVLQLKKVYTNGVFEQVQTITKMSGERMSGFPQIERLGDTLYIATTAVTGKETAIEVFSFPIY